MGTSIQSTSSQVINQAILDNTLTSSAVTDKQPEQQKTAQPPGNVDQAAKQHASEQMNHHHLQGQLLQSQLQMQAKASKSSGAAKPKSSDAKVGELNHAKVAKWQRGYLYDFGKPVTKEQAAQFIFEDGKVPDKAKLVEGPGNTWHVQMPQALKDQTEVVFKMKHKIMENSHEQINTKEITWVDGPPIAHTPARPDLKNNYGFKVSKHYDLDSGQYTVGQLNSLTGKGKGYELQFDMPMTKDQIMNMLYEKDKMPNKDDVRLIPVGNEPSQTWQVHVMETGSAKLKPAMHDIFGAANVYTEKSVAPSVPSGLRAHLENKTIPSDAVAHPKGEQHPPGAYVWEQDGHLVYVLTDGKGKDGFYHYEVTRLDSKNQQYNKDMRYYMKEMGMPPRMALAAFTQQWDELSRMILGGFAVALSSGRLPGKNPFGQMEKSMVSRWRSARGVPAQRNASVPKPSTSAPRIAHEAPAPKPVQKPAVDVNAPTTGIGKATTQPGPKPAHANSVPKGVNTNGATVSTNPPQAKPVPKGQATVDTGGKTVSTNPPQKTTGGDIGAKKTKAAPHQTAQNDSRTIEIKTNRGNEKITVGELKGRQKKAFEWREAEARKLSLETEKTPGAYRTPASFWKQLDGEVKKRFNLPDGWELL